MTIIPSPRSQKRARIEIIPLIDIMFFLLATFVMVSLSMVKNQGIPVRLPGATTGQPRDRKDAATISVSAQGEVYYDKEQISLEALRSRLKQQKDAAPDFKIFINGDEDARLGVAIQVLDVARNAGISKVAFETRPQ
jgi:biopolymer transport protein ExbD